MKQSQPLEIASAALVWLARHAAQLTNFDPTTAPAEHHQVAVAEHALLLWLSCRIPVPDNWRGQRTTLHEAVREAYNAPAFHSFIEQGPPESVIGALVIRLGLGEEIADDIVPRDRLIAAIRKRNVITLERTPTRLLELRLVLDHLNIPHDLPSTELLLSASMLARKFNEEALRPSDIYVLTHLIPYLTDFGFALQALKDSAGVDMARKLVERLIDRMIGERHWDLVSELLTCRHCLASPPRPTHHRAWDALSKVQEPDGSIGAMAMASTISAAAQDSAAFRYDIWLGQYHKCLVTVIAALTFIPRGVEGWISHPDRRLRNHTVLGFGSRRL